MAARAAFVSGATRRDVSSRIRVPAPMKEDPITVFPPLFALPSHQHLQDPLLHTFYSSLHSAGGKISVFTFPLCRRTFYHPAVSSSSCSSSSVRVRMRRTKLHSYVSATVLCQPNPRAWLTQHRSSGSDKCTTKLFCEE